MSGRGRGRGRGGPSGQIVRDDDGNILEAAGPPPMFPVRHLFMLHLPYSAPNP